VITDGAIGVPEFAIHVSEIPEAEMQWLKDLAANAKWRDVEGRGYDTADVDFWEPCNRAFFIRIPPNGDIPRHHDCFIPGITHHLVLSTNPNCENWWIDDQGQERMTHLNQGHRYLVSREPLHWAFNKGETDRIHLLVEFP
jgi:hypothetical protein